LAAGGTPACLFSKAANGPQAHGVAQAEYLKKINHANHGQCEDSSIQAYMKNGLDAPAVAARLQQYGYNELPAAARKNFWRIALEVMKEPMFLLLISCGILYVVLGDYKEGIVLLSTILLIIGITFFQSHKTERALEALKNLSSPRALVLRDGKETRIPGREVVPGDILLLHEGDRVPADAVLVEATNLAVDESLLTGEAMPVEKRHEADADAALQRVFSGSLIVQGRAIAEVTHTGSATEMGKIGTSLSTIVQDETRLQKEMKRLIRSLAFIGIFLSLAVVLLFYFTRGNFIQSLLNGLSASMALLPEEFPVVLTVFLALGAWRLSQKHVLTRRPSAIETLGSATVLCSDKTGTITQNQMEVAAVYVGHAHILKRDFAAQQEKIGKLLTAGFFATQEESIDPMEKAIVQAHGDLRLQPAQVPTCVREYPFSHDFQAMVHVMEAGADGIHWVASKGAPETIFKLCNLSPEATAQYVQAQLSMARQGLRVIAVAEAFHPQGEPLPEIPSAYTFQCLGLLAFEDPIRPEVPEAIAQCRQAGIKVIMITGDFPETAISIGRQIGLPGADAVITGTEMDAMDDATLRLRIQDTSIFARVVPAQKLRIVEALKANGAVVAMTGDGVNDAPALKAAHIGIAMGKKGTDVAREAAALVLLDDNFASIVSAMRLGRRIFDNLQKAMAYIIAIHIPIIGFTLLPAFITALPLFLLPLHIVFLELIIDPICSIAFESEQEEKGIMQRPPRKPDEVFFGGRRILSSIVKGLLVLGMVLLVYVLSIQEGHTEKEVRAIAFSSLVIGNVFLILSQLSLTRSFARALIEGNKALLAILLAAMALLLLMISVPVLQNLFSFEFPGYRHFIPSFLGAFGILLVLEGWKIFSIKRTRRKMQIGSRFEDDHTFH
jgi:P-type Ca2+ transporter type 2C